MNLMNFESHMQEIKIDEEKTQGEEQMNALADQDTINLPVGTAKDGQNSPIQQEVDPVSNSTIPARKHIKIAF